MEETNVIFEVTKVGFAVNTKWSVFVDNEYIGKIDFKNNLAKKLSKGVHTVQYKVGVQKTKILNINVADEEIVVECIWDGTVRNFHVVGGESNNNENDISENNETKNNNKDYTFCSNCGKEIKKGSAFCSYCGNKIEQETINKENNTPSQNNTNNMVPKDRNALIIIFVIICLIVGFIFFKNIGVIGDNNSNNSKTTSIENDAKSAALQVITVENKYYLNSSYSIGKITSKNAVLDSKSGEWYLFKCTYSYNPLNRAGSTMLDREDNGQVYVGIKMKENDMFNYKFGRTLEDLKSKLN
ncbi:MAG: zinc ribbon domain-containing protein [Clostridia bacterium]|nr:zinc ribbon domain-containing protein [Clostridia bacterium]